MKDNHHRQTRFEALIDWIRSLSELDIFVYTVEALLIAFGLVYVFSFG